MKVFILQNIIEGKIIRSIIKTHPIKIINSLVGVDNNISTEDEIKHTAGQKNISQSHHNISVMLRNCILVSVCVHVRFRFFVFVRLHLHHLYVSVSVCVVVFMSMHSSVSVPMYISTCVQISVSESVNMSVCVS